MTRQVRWIYCQQARAMIATIKRGGTGRNWNNSSGTSAALDAHLERCQKCARDRGDEPWPPK